MSYEFSPGDEITAERLNSLIGWEKLGETILDAPATSISVAGFPARKFLKIFVHIVGASGNFYLQLRFNNDSGNNYTWAFSQDGGGLSEGVNASFIYLLGTAYNYRALSEISVINLADQRKLITGQTVMSAPILIENGGEWYNTADQITRVDILSGAVSTFNAGSRITILGRN